MAIEKEKQTIATVAEQTGLMKHKILHQRKIMGGVNAAKENEYMVQKQVSTTGDIQENEYSTTSQTLFRGLGITKIASGFISVLVSQTVCRCNDI